MYFGCFGLHETTLFLLGYQFLWENSGLFIILCFYFTVAKDLAKLARNDKSQLRRRHSITLCESRHRKSSTDSNTSTEVFLFSFSVPNKRTDFFSLLVILQFDFCFIPI